MTGSPSLKRRLSASLLAILLLVLSYGKSTSAQNLSPFAPQKNPKSTPTSTSSGAQTPTSASPAIETAPADTLPQVQQGIPMTPLGTAAAPDIRTDGVASSTVSGAAISPIKQKRIRTFSMRTALLVGAIVAIGVVGGLTLATTAHP